MGKPTVPIIKKGKVLWLTGLSGAGKTTLARAIRAELAQLGIAACVLDGDEIREGLSSDLRFSESDRAENNRRVAEVARVVCLSGICSIVALISPFEEHCRRARKIMETSQVTFLEIFVNAPLSVCEHRDVKGYYKQARGAKIQNFTGIQMGYEAPTSPDIEVFSGTETIEACLQKVMDALHLGQPAD